MNVSSDSNQEFIQLCGLYRDQQLDDVQFDRLQALMREDDDRVKTFYRFMSLCSGLEQVAGLKAGTDRSEADLIAWDETVVRDFPVSEHDVNEDPVTRLARKTPANRRVWMTVIAAVAAILLLVATIVVRERSSAGGSESFSVASVRDLRAQWADGMEPDLNPATGSRDVEATYSLNSGAVDFVFENGASLLIQSPAVVSFASDHTPMLLAGTGVIAAPQVSAGLRLRTPFGDVVDRGTRIGVHVDDQAMQVHVLEGTAEVFPASTKLGQTLRAGNAMTVTADQEDAALRIDQRHFLQELAIVDELPIVTGGIELRVMPPRSVRRVRSEATDTGRGSIFREQIGLVLDEDIPVTQTQAGILKNLNRRTEVVPAGTRVDSFLVHLAVPKRLRRSDSHLVAEGTIEFARPVLGIATSEPAKMDARFETDATDYPRDRRTGLEDSVDGNSDLGDFVQLSDDKRTVTIRLNVFGREANEQADFIDQIRILQQSQGD